MSCELVLILGYFMLLVTDEADVDTNTLAMHRNIAGYLRVRFSPEVVRVSQGETATGHVHVTVQSHHYIDNSEQDLRAPALDACVVDRTVATASWSSDDTELTTCSLLSSVHVWEETAARREVAVIYAVAVHGVLIGRSAVRFYVIKTGSDVTTNETAHRNYNQLAMNDDLAVITSPHNHLTQQTVTQSNANDVSDDVSRLPINVSNSVNMVDMKPGANDVITVTQRWWVADEYEIIVMSAVRRTTVDLLSYLLLAVTTVNLVGAGGQFDCDEAAQLVRRPPALAVGLFCRFAVMPAVSLTSAAIYSTLSYDNNKRRAVAAQTARSRCKVQSIQ